MADPATETNVPKTEDIRAAVAKIEECFEELLSEKGSYMQRCRQIREGITSAYDIAKQQGIPKKELRALVKERDFERKYQQVRADLEADEQLTFDMLKERLGDFGNTPLGQAALDDVARAQPGTLDQLQPH